jgi:hypothetical protein
MLLPRGGTQPSDFSWVAPHSMKGALARASSTCTKSACQPGGNAVHDHVLEHGNPSLRCLTGVIVGAGAGPAGPRAIGVAAPNPKDIHSLQQSLSIQ